MTLEQGYCYCIEQAFAAPARRTRHKTYNLKLHLLVQDRDPSQSGKAAKIGYWNFSIRPSDDTPTAFLPDETGKYRVQRMGDQLPFKNREYAHKNFELNIPQQRGIRRDLLFQGKHHQTADAIIVLRSVNRFIQYALDEYFIFRIFYGMVLLVFGSIT